MINLNSSSTTQVYDWDGRPQLFGSESGQVQPKENNLNFKMLKKFTLF